MANPVISFVNGPLAAPTVIVALNPSDSLYVAAEDFSWGAPGYSAEPDSVGAQYGWREQVSFTIVLKGTSYSAIASAQQAIARQLLAISTWLMLDMGGTSPKQFLRVYRTAQQAMSWDVADFGEWRLPVTLRCDPWITGTREDAVVAAVVTADPAAAARGLFFDTPVIKGDFETPAVLWAPAGTATGIESGQTLYTAVEPAPPGGVYVAQAEGGAFGTDTAVAGANDPLMSGAGNNYARVSFATSSALAQRLTVTIPAGTLPVGDYRVFARLRSSTGTSVHTIQMGLGPTSSYAASDNARATTTVTPGTTPKMFDLGLMPSLAGLPAANVGFDTMLPAPSVLTFRATRDSGGGTLDFDYILLVPDGCMSKTLFKAAAPGAGVTGWVMDAVQNRDYFLLSNASPFNAAARNGGNMALTERGGRFPVLSPGAVNRIHALLTGVAVSQTSAWNLSYWPRYLHMRPDAT